MTAKHLYLVRHCQAHGQEVSASLTEAGFQQAERLVSFLKGKNRPDSLKSVSPCHPDRWAACCCAGT